VDLLATPGIGHRIGAEGCEFGLWCAAFADRAQRRLRSAAKRSKKVGLRKQTGARDLDRGLVDVATEDLHVRHAGSRALTELLVQQNPVAVPDCTTAVVGQALEEHVCRAMPPEVTDLGQELQ